MKFYTFVLVILFYFSVSTVFGQHKKSKVQSQNEEFLIGIWRVDTIVMKNMQDLGEYYDLYLEKYKELKEKTSFEFNKDKTYIKNGLRGLQKKGIWRMSSDGKRIIVKMEATNKDEESRVIRIDKDTLIIAPLEESSNSKVVLYKVKENE